MDDYHERSIKDTLQQFFMSLSAPMPSSREDTEYERVLRCYQDSIDKAMFLYHAGRYGQAVEMLSASLRDVCEAGYGNDDIHRWAHELNVREGAIA